MKKWLLRIVYAALVLLPVGAIADYTATQGTGSTIFAFVCSTTKICPAMVLIDSSNVEKGTAANPLTVQGTGASGATLSGSPFRVGISDGTNAQNLLAAIALADGVNGNNTAAVAGWLWNGATYDRQRGDLTNGAFVNVKTSVLPTGAGTSANQSTINTSLGTINTSLGTLATHADAIAAIPPCAAAPCLTTVGDVGIDVSSGKGTPASAAISVSTATTTQLVALSGSTKIYVTSYDVIAGGTGNITFEYGTGSACGTGTTVLTGAYNLTAQAGIAKGNGAGAVLVVPAGNALCVLTSAAVQMSGSISYQQF